MKAWHIGSYILIILGLIGCGGGGGGDNNATLPPLMSNLRYSPSSTLAGVGVINVEATFDISNRSGGALTIVSTDSDGQESSELIDDSTGIYEATISVESTLDTTDIRTYTFTIWLVDSYGKSSDQLTGSINIVNGIPVANAYPDYLAWTTGTNIELDGTNSSDPNGDAIFYNWSIIEAPPSSQATIAMTQSSTVNFVPDVDGEYRVRLIVNDGLEDSDAYEKTIVSIPTEFFTVGSHKDDVALIQGTPRTINNWFSTYDWDYSGIGLGKVTFSTDTDRVVSWNDYDGILNKIIVPGNNITADTRFTVGSHKDDVARIQGTPKTINNWFSTYEWDYSGIGLGKVTFSIDTDRVVSWNNYDGILLTR
jgi:hypothetical protein